MDIFDTFFTLFMILFPAVFASFIRVRPGTDEQRGRRRKLTLRLWLATAVTALAYLLLARWQPTVTYVMWCAFFPLWFWLAMPLLRAHDPQASCGGRLARRQTSPRTAIVPKDIAKKWAIS